MQTSPPKTKLSVVAEPQPKSKGFRRPILEILEDLQKPVPERFLAHRKQGGASLTYIPWYNVNKLLDYYAPGWEGQVTSITSTTDRVFLIYRITIHAAEGAFSREATGTELLNTKFTDPLSKSESMAFRRCAARLGLGLYLYSKDE